MGRVVRELSAQMPAKVGLLAEVSEAFAAAGVNIQAVLAYEMEGVGNLTFVTDDNAAAIAALEALGAETSETDVVAVDLAHQPGALAQAAGKIAAAGINVDYSYGTVCGCDSATIYFHCDDAAAAAVALG